MAYLVLTPAYGRDYKSKTALLEDFNANKDFRIASVGYSGYANKHELTGNTVELRYDQLRKLHVEEL